MANHSPELQYLALTAGLTGLLWVPIIANRLRERGPWSALRNPQPDVRADADWAYRLANAHRNAIENLVVFSPLALATHTLGLSNATTATASAVFFGARLAHALIYTFGIPLLRTVAFAVGFACQMVLLARVLGL